MTPAEVAALAGRAAPDEGASRDELIAALDAVQRGVAWFEAQRLRCGRLLAAVDAFAEQTIAEVTRSNPRDGRALRERAETVDVAPAFGDALASGDIHAAHLDELARSRRRIGDDRFDALLDEAPRLLGYARSTTPDRFADELRRTERRLDPSAGLSQLERQRGAVRLWERVERDDGMYTFTVRLDPLAGLKLSEQLAAATEALFHDRHPEHIPLGGADRQAFLRAHALLALIEGKGARPGRPEVIVVVDTRTPDAPSIDWGADVDLPPEVLREVAARAVVRTTRLASPAQRRVLRGLYPGCAVPGCSVRFNHCTVHHVRWWRHHGPTDLANLLPLCHRHHDETHRGVLDLHLDAERTLTVTVERGPPNGRQVSSTGLPGRGAGFSRG